MFGSVVEQNQSLGAGIASDSRCFQPGAVAPSSAVLILLGSELGVADEHVGIAGIFAENGIELRVAMFKIGSVNDYRAIALKAKTECALRMIHGEGTDNDAGVFGAALDLVKLLLCSQKVEGNGEIGRDHLSFQGLAHGFGRQSGEERHAVRFRIERAEKRQALDVIPVKMGHQDLKVQTHSGELL